MLQSLVVKNLALVETLELDFSPGMTAITGETGAGKSILIDALNLALGDRADSQLVRHNATRAEICLHFDLSSSPSTRAMLATQELENENECTLRRTISPDGRSKAYINDTPVSLQQLRQIGEALVDIHGQHAHHALLHPAKHLELLDHFANNHELTAKITSLYQQWQKINHALNNYEKTMHERESRVSLLQFQIEELKNLALSENTWEAMLQEHKQLANAEQLLSDCNSALGQLMDDENNSVQRSLAKATHLLTPHASYSPVIANTADLLNQMAILLEEVGSDVHHLTSSLEMNPSRLMWLDQQIGRRHEAARKYRTTPEKLPELFELLETELAELQQSDMQQQDFIEQLAVLEKEYLVICEKLTLSRKNAAERLNKEVSILLRTLAMPEADFAVQFTSLDDKMLSPHGKETVEFVVNTNPGMPWYPLHKIASGGELSRISLAIQVVAAKHGSIPVLVFDEVDVGIGGSTAETVGQLLRRLGEHAQVVSVTHQPQVASQSHHHLRVEKYIVDDKTFSKATYLNATQRVEEIARMLGGAQITPHTRAHAKEMLELSKG